MGALYLVHYLIPMSSVRRRKYALVTMLHSLISETDYKKGVTSHTCNAHKILSIVYNYFGVRTETTTPFRVTAIILPSTLSGSAKIASSSSSPPTSNRATT